MFDEDFELDLKELTVEDLHEFIKAVKSDIQRALNVSRDTMYPKMIQMQEHVSGKSIEEHKKDQLNGLYITLKEFEDELALRS